MKMPAWLRVKIATKASIALRLSPSVIGWAILIGSYVLTRGQSHLRVL